MFQRDGSLLFHVMIRVLSSLLMQSEIIIYGRGLVSHKIVQTLSNFIADRLMAALLFWFFDGFKCGVLLFSLYINIKIGENSC